MANRALIGICTAGFVALVVGGCESDDSGGPATDLSWHKDAAPIIIEHCSGCHEDSNTGAAPFPLTTYEEVKNAGELVRWAVESGAMPPWPAKATDDCMPPLPFKGDLQLSAAQKTVLVDWVEGGMPEGDKASAAMIPPPKRSPSLNTWDAELVVPETWTSTTGKDEYICYRINTGIGAGQTKWIRAFEVVPGPVPPTHHVLIYTTDELTTDKTSWPCFGGAACSGSAQECGDVGSFDYNLLGAWAPGTGPTVFPSDGEDLVSAYPLSSTDSLILQVHYSPASNATTGGQTALRLKWQDETPAYGVGMHILGVGSAGSPDAFTVPANTVDFKTQITQSPGLGAVIWGVIPHQHTYGKSIKVSIERSASADSTCLVNVPVWDFDWQRLYAYDYTNPFDLPQIEPGDKIVLDCAYTNRTSEEVSVGEATTEEMCIVVVGTASPLN